MVLAHIALSPGEVVSVAGCWNFYRNPLKFGALSKGDPNDLWLETEVEIEPEKNTQPFGCISGKMHELVASIFMQAIGLLFIMRNTRHPPNSFFAQQ